MDRNLIRAYAGHTIKHDPRTIELISFCHRRKSSSGVLLPLGSQQNHCEQVPFPHTSYILFPCHPNQCHYVANLKTTALCKAVKAFTTVNSVHCRDINFYIKSQLNVLHIVFHSFTSPRHVSTYGTSSSGSAPSSKNLLVQFLKMMFRASKHVVK
jgi:hypothetical protein